VSRRGDIVVGALIGLIYYVIYIVILPQIHRALGAGSIRGDVHVDIPLAAFFLALGAMASVVRGTIFSFIINALIKILGLLSYLYLVHGKPISIAGTTSLYSIEISISPEPMIYVVSIWTLATILVDILSVIERLRPAIPGAVAYIREALG